MSTEQLCYIPCNFCNIVLAVSVPYSCLFEIVTVRCGHCTNLWSVNMAAAAFQSLSCQNYFQAQNKYYNSVQDYRTSTTIDQHLGSSSIANKKAAIRNHNANQERVLNRLPEKRQRVPSAYNQFIKEEIQRIKANKPEITHREAFSTAAKNWAHFPHIQFGLMLETNNGTKINDVVVWWRLIHFQAILSLYAQVVCAVFGSLMFNKRSTIFWGIFLDRDKRSLFCRRWRHTTEGK